MVPNVEESREQVGAPRLEERTREQCMMGRWEAGRREKLKGISALEIFGEEERRRWGWNFSLFVG